MSHSVNLKQIERFDLEHLHDALQLFERRVLFSAFHAGIEVDVYISCIGDLLLCEFDSLASSAELHTELFARF